MRVSSAASLTDSLRWRGVQRIVLYPMRVRDMTRFGFTDVLFPDRSDAPPE
jgi:hypothetical protein